MKLTSILYLCAFVLPFELAGQDEIVPQTYGTSSQIVLHIPAVSFVPVDGGDKLEDGTGQVYHGGPGSKLVTGVMFPTGARLQAMDFYYDDTNLIFPCVARLYTLEGTTTNTVTEVVVANSVGGEGKNVVTVNFDHTVNNTNRQYVVYVSNTSSTRKFRAVAFRYRLQVSPGPAVATFADVPRTHPFFRFVEALAASGVTGGCGGGNFCPDAPITRGQMAVFLSAALGLHWAP